MARVSFSKIGETPFQQLLGHVPEIMIDWNKLGDKLTETNNLEYELKEQVRRVLAYGNGFEYCMAKGKPNQINENEKTSIAVAFAEMFVKYRKEIDAKAFSVLRTVFTEEQIVELCSFICFISASQMFGALMDLKP